MDANVFQERSKKTAVYRGHGTGNEEALVYVALGLASEAGEVGNYMAKIWRDGDSAERREKMAKELGDVLWYAARLADELGVKLGDVMQANLDKLESRMARGTIGGFGDER